MSAHAHSEVAISNGLQANENALIGQVHLLGRVKPGVVLDRIIRSLGHAANSGETQTQRERGRSAPAH